MSYIKASIRVSFSLCIIALVSLFLVGCMSQSKKKESSSEKYISQVSKLEKEVRDLATQNSVLKSAVKRSKAETSVVPQSNPSLVLNTKDISGEHSLYTAALESYWARDLEKLKRLNSMLIKTFPKSVHADNALYLQASLLYNQGALAESLQTLNRIIKDYPLANKAVSAELMKAMIYARLNLAEQAREIYLRISKQYPGSPESRQAALQINETGSINPASLTPKKVIK